MTTLCSCGARYNPRTSPNCPLCRPSLEHLSTYDLRGIIMRNGSEAAAATRIVESRMNQEVSRDVYQFLRSDDRDKRREVNSHRRSERAIWDQQHLA